MSSGVLAIWTDVAPEAEDDFNAWYNHQHLAERSAIPGFRNGRRFRVVSGSPRYLALYETDSVGGAGLPRKRARTSCPSSERPNAIRWCTLWPPPARASHGAKLWTSRIRMKLQ